MAQALPQGTLQTSIVSMDPTAKASVSAPITINLGGGASVSGGNDVGATNARKEGNGRNKGVGEAVGADADGSEQDTEEEADEDAGENPWLAPTAKKSRERRRASEAGGKGGAAVVLDVRKAAATALSAFSEPSGGISSGERQRDGLEGMDNGRGDAGNKRRSVDSAGKRRTEQGGEPEHGSGKANRKRARKSNNNNNNTDGSVDNTGRARAHESTGKVLPKGGSPSGAHGEESSAANGGVSKGASHSSSTGTKNKRREKNKKQKRKGDAEGSSRADASGTQVAEVATGKDGKGNNRSKLGGLSNDELVRRAFATPDFETEFKDFKDDEMEASVAKGREKLPGDVAGWGTWTGEGAKAPSTAFVKRRREAEAIQVLAGEFGCVLLLLLFLFSVILLVGFSLVRGKLRARDDGFCRSFVGFPSLFFFG